MLMSVVETNKDASYVSGFVVASDGCKASDAGNVSGVCTASDASNASPLTPWVMGAITFTIFCDETRCFDRYGRCRGNGSIICMWM